MRSWRRGGVKVIRPEILAADPQAAHEIERRFQRELLLARQVTHKNVVRIHDLGEIDGIKYITMPYLDGSDLATILKTETKLPLSRALRITRGIVSGLIAHEAGVVHRDSAGQHQSARRTSRPSWISASLGLPAAR
jgi:serine/threonine-protein kinase